MGSGEIDLFGHPVRPGFGGRGRPPFVATEKDRSKVKYLLALGWDGERIRAQFGISKQVFRREFLNELKCRAIARDALEAMKLERAIEQLEAGKLGAVKVIDALVARADREKAQREIDRAGQAPHAMPRAVAKGKKIEVAERAASLIAADPLLQPRLIN